MILVFPSKPKHPMPRLYIKEIIGFVPSVHIVRGDIGMFVRGLHIPTTPAGSLGIMQVHALDDHLSISSSCHEILAVPSMPHC